MLHKLPSTALVFFVLFASSGWSAPFDLRPGSACSLVFDGSAIAAEPPRRGTITEREEFFGPVLHYKANPLYRGRLKDVLRIGTYNISSKLDGDSSTEYHNMMSRIDEGKRMGNAKIIRDFDPDFQLLVEIENVDAAENMIRRGLNSKYHNLLIPGNDQKGINISLLVRKDLPVEILWKSHRNIQKNGQTVFSRDLPVGLVFDRDDHGRVQRDPRLIFVGVHYKSRRRSHGDPRRQQERRELQVEYTLRVVNELRRHHGDRVPIVLLGDLNNDIHDAEEFKPLFRQGFIDTLDRVPNRKQHRPTFFYFNRERLVRDEHQFDAILVQSTKRIRVLSGGVLPYLDSEGHVLSPPKDIIESRARPSDHQAIGVEIHL